MRAVWHRIRAGWSSSDTVVLGGNFAAFLLFLGNCWWDSVNVAYWGSLAPLGLQCGWLGVGNTALRNSLIFGGLVALAWPFGEYAIVHGVGWWGTYTAPGPAILETPVYAMLICALASAYCYYLAIRATAMGFSITVSVALAGATALMLGIIGENLFVLAGMWTYVETPLAFWAVPAFIPVAYGLNFAFMAMLQRYAVPVITLAFLFATLITSVGLGLLTGFFPR